MTEHADLAIIGGSGLYEMPGLRETRQHNIDTPFGETSAPIIAGTLEGKRVAFLARHGIGHHITPSGVPTAPTSMLKSLGVQRSSASAPADRSRGVCAGIS
jgi:5'-methylthioadenosine phosphorylase